MPKDNPRERLFELHRALDEEAASPEPSAEERVILTDIRKSVEDALVKLDNSAADEIDPALDELKKHLVSQQEALRRLKKVSENLEKAMQSLTALPGQSTTGSGGPWGR